MAYRELTLGLPDTTPTGFSSVIVPPLILRDWEEYPIRSPFKIKKHSGYSLNGTPLITGEQYGVRYSWGVKKTMTASEARHLGILFNYQQSSGNNLRLWDEVEELDPETAPHSRTLLVDVPEPLSPGMVYGFGVFNIWIELPDEFKTDFGINAKGINLKTVKFLMTETTV